jgi:hypothetical protein
MVCERVWPLALTRAHIVSGIKATSGALSGRRDRSGRSQARLRPPCVCRLEEQIHQDQTQTTTTQVSMTASKIAGVRTLRAANRSGSHRHEDEAHHPLALSVDAHGSLRRGM